MPYQHKIFLVMIFSTLMLSACQSEHETSTPQPVEVEEPASSTEEHPALTEQSTLPIKQPAVQITTPPINLDVTQQSLKQLYNEEDQEITADAPVRITKQSDGAQKTEISGGVLLDEQGSMMNDGVDNIDGAEVKISVPLH